MRGLLLKMKSDIIKDWYCFDKHTLLYSTLRSLSYIGENSDILYYVEQGIFSLQKGNVYTWPTKAVNIIRRR